jgi:hypothetical protein
MAPLVHSSPSAARHKKMPRVTTYIHESKLKRKYIGLMLSKAIATNVILLVQRMLANLPIAIGPCEANALLALPLS